LKRSPTKRLSVRGRRQRNNGCALQRNRFMWPERHTLRREIVRLHHDPPVAGQPGDDGKQWKWSHGTLVGQGSPKFVFDTWMYGDKCQRSNTNFQQPAAGSLMPIGTPRWTRIGNLSGLIVGLPGSPRNRCTSSLVVCSSQENRHT